MDINVVILTGRLAQDPELKYFDSGSVKASFSIANSKWNSKEKKEIAQFFNCEVWSRQAEFISEYGRKGSPITIQGTLESSNYEDKDGNKKTRVFVRVENFTLPKTAKSESAKKDDEEIATEEEIPF